MVAVDLGIKSIVKNNKTVFVRTSSKHVVPEADAHLWSRCNRRTVKPGSVALVLVRRFNVHVKSCKKNKQNYNKKHSENADTSTSVTFDLDV